MVGFSEVFRAEGGALDSIAKQINQAVVNGTYKLEFPLPHPYHPEWIDTLFMNTTVDDLIFNGTIPGALQFVFDKKMASVGTLLPPQIQEENGFAALNTKNGSYEMEW